MTTNRITLAAAALLGLSLGANAALAQGGQPQQAPQSQAPTPDRGMMGQGGMMGRMDPAQMTRMMENCNKVMESMQHSPSAPQGAQPRNG